MGVKININIGMQIKKKHILLLFGYNVLCGCDPYFRYKCFGILHWWKYNQIRKWWRNFNFNNNTQGGCDPCMTKDEYEHWYEKRKVRKYEND